MIDKFLNQKQKIKDAIESVNAEINEIRVNKIIRIKDKSDKIKVLENKKIRLEEMIRGLNYKIKNEEKLK